MHIYDNSYILSKKQKGWVTMDYKKLYFHLFNALTDAIEEIQTGDVLTARDILIRAQQETEEMYLEG